MATMDGKSFFSDDMLFLPATYRLVPWVSWDEWDAVRECLFSSSSDDISFALARISAWRGRGCIPNVIEVTASIIETQQKDRSFRNNSNDDITLSDNILAMLYCMAIIRLVNLSSEKGCRQRFSIAEVAKSIGMPRMLIDIRHEASHRVLPSIHVARIASTAAVDWVKSYYWESQKKAILSRSMRISHIENKVKRRLWELVLVLKSMPSLPSTWKREKGMRYGHLSKLHHPSVNGKQLLSLRSRGRVRERLRRVKQLGRLYCSHPSVVVGVLVMILKMAVSVANFIIPTQGNLHTVFSLDDWKLVVRRLGHRVRDLYLSIFSSVIDVMHAETERGDFSSSNALLIDACEWMARHLKSPPQLLLKKCLLIVPFYREMTGCAVAVSRAMGLDGALISRVNRLCLLFDPDFHEKETAPPLSLSQATQQLQLLTMTRRHTEAVESDGDVTRKRKRWKLAASWNACPFGMLPDPSTPLGTPPILDIIRRSRVTGRGPPTDGDDAMDEDAHLGGDDRNPLADEDADTMSIDAHAAALLIGGIWRPIKADELSAIKSSIRILV